MRLENVLDQSIRELNEKNLQDLDKKAESGKITWVLGAGVSAPAGLPQWKMLLAKIWARLSEMGYEIDTDDLNKESAHERSDKSTFSMAYEANVNSIRNVEGYRKKVKDAYGGGYKQILSQTNVLESAEYMWNYIGDFTGNNENLQMQMLKSLIRGSLSIDLGEEELKKRLLGQAVEVLSKRLAHNKKETVITYNYDNILEFCLQKIEGLGEADVRVLCDIDEDKAPDENKVNIHHPHGVVKVMECDLGRDSKKIILTESSYYEMERYVYIWENSVQAKALAETSCIFVGFSGEDYNFRRIIKHSGPRSSDETAKHYIFFCIDDLVKDICGEDVTKLQEEEFIYERLQLINMLYMRYSYWKRHGIIPIWSTFDELPEMIAKMKIKALD